MEGLESRGQIPCTLGMGKHDHMLTSCGQGCLPANYTESGHVHSLVERPIELAVG